jgi:hypothetical protein
VAYANLCPPLKHTWSFDIQENCPDDADGVCTNAVIDMPAADCEDAKDCGIVASTMTVFAGRTVTMMTAVMGALSWKRVGFHSVKESHPSHQTIYLSTCGGLSNDTCQGIILVDNGNILVEIPFHEPIIDCQCPY